MLPRKTSEEGSQKLDVDAQSIRSALAEIEHGESGPPESTLVAYLRSRASSDQLGSAALVLAVSGSPDAQSAAYLYMSRILRSYIRYRWPAFTADDIEDIVTDTVLKTTDRATRSIDDIAKWPGGGYVIQTAYTTAVDKWRRLHRRQEREEPVDQAILAEVLISDDDIAARFEQSETARSMVLALQRVRKAEDHMTFRVVTAALDETEAEGRPPSNRKLAERLGLSHTSVNAAMKRFRTYYLAANQEHD